MSVGTSPAVADEVPRSIFAPGLRSASVGAAALISLLALEYIAVGAAMPTIAADLDGYHLYNMAFGSTVAASVVGMVVGGWWSDRAGPRQVTVVGVGLFTLGLLVAGLALTMEVFVAGRAVQGLGSGLTTVAVYVVIAQRVPDARRPAVFSLLAAAWVVPGLAGPLLTGLIVEHLTWHWVFLGVAPFALLSLLVFWRALTGTHAGDDASFLRPSTIVWAVVAAVGVGILNLGGERVDGIERVVGPLVLLLVAVASWRLLPVGTLFLARGLPSVIAVRAAMGGSFLAAEAYLPLMLRDEHGYSPAQAGAVLAVASVAWAAGSWIQGRLGEGVDRYRLMAAGVVTFATMMVLLAVAVWAEWPGWAPILVYGLATLGVGLAYPTTTLLVMRLSPPAEIGRNSSALQVGESLTGAVALALTGVVFGYFYATQPHVSFVGTLAVAALVGSVAVVGALRSAPSTAR